MSMTERLQATLLMESHGLAPDVRSATFSSISVRSRLHQTGPYLLDLVLGTGGTALALRGERIAQAVPLPREATVTRYDPEGAAVTTSAHDGTFHFELVNAGSYRLDLTAAQEQSTLSGIMV